MHVFFDAKGHHQTLKTREDDLPFDDRNRWRTWAKENIPRAVEIEQRERDGDISEPKRLVR